MKIEQLIREKVSFLSAGQKKVAEYILQHLDSFSYSTLAKLSKEISVSETTIIRLAYSLGFESFSEMQRTVQNDILSIPTATADDTLDNGNFYQNIIAKELHSMENWASHLSQDDMDQIVTYLTNAKKRLIVGARSSYSAALWMGTLLNQLLGNTKVVHEFYDPHFEYLTEASEDTVVLLLSFARYTKWSLKYAQVAQDHGAKIFHHRHGLWQIMRSLQRSISMKWDLTPFPVSIVFLTALLQKSEKASASPSVHAFMTWKNFTQTLIFFTNNNYRGDYHAGNFRYFS